MLEIEEDLPLQRATWRLQRVGWVLSVVVLAVASAGFLGGTREPNRTMDLPGMTVAYSSPQRQGSESQIIVHFAGAPEANARDANLSVGDAFLARVSDVVFTPTPVEMISEPGRLRVRFAPIPAKVILSYTAVEWGRLPLALGTAPQNFGTRDLYVLP